MLIDLCGTPIQLEQIKSFRLVKREYLFYPAYRETVEQSFSLFARAGAKEKKKFIFVQMVPYGALLSEKEKPSMGSYEIKAFGEAATANILAEVGKAIGNVANLAADLLRVDTSGNQEFSVLTQGRRVTKIKLRDVPAKVSFLSGKVSDVYRNDPIYEFLGEPIAPTIVTVPALVITADKITHVFFGNGIDIENAEETYHSILDAYNQLHMNTAQDKTPLLSKVKLSLPKLSMPSIRFQSPILLNNSKAQESAKLEIESENEGCSGLVNKDETQI